MRLRRWLFAFAIVLLVPEEVVGGDPTTPKDSLTVIKNALPADDSDLNAVKTGLTKVKQELKKWTDFSDLDTIAKISLLTNDAVVKKMYGDVKQISGKTGADKDARRNILREMVTAMQATSSGAGNGTNTTGANKQSSGNGTSTTKPASNASNTTKPKPASNASNTTKPKPASNASNTTKPASNASNTTKPGAQSTKTPKPASNASNTTKPTPVNTTGDIAEVSVAIPGFDLKKFDPDHKKDMRESMVKLIANLSKVSTDQVEDMDGNPGNVTLKAGSVRVMGKVPVPQGSSATAIRTALSTKKAKDQFKNDAVDLISKGKGRAKVMDGKLQDEVEVDVKEIKKKTASDTAEPSDATAYYFWSWYKDPEPSKGSKEELRRLMDDLVT